MPGQPKLVLLGKQAQFPLDDESRRVRLHTQNVADEEPFRLLLHPCLDLPEDHLTYDAEALVHPKNHDDLKAVTSIFVYALQRKALVEERKRVLNELQIKLVQLKSLAAEFNEMVGNIHAPESQRKIGQLSIQMKAISSMFRRGEPYLGMLRDYLRRNLSAGGFDDLVHTGIDLRRLLP